MTFKRESTTTFLCSICVMEFWSLESASGGSAMLCDVQGYLFTIFYCTDKEHRWNMNGHKKSMCSDTRTNQMRRTRRKQEEAKVLMYVHYRQSVRTHRLCFQVDRYVQYGTNTPAPCERFDEQLSQPINHVLCWCHKYFRTNQISAFGLMTSAFGLMTSAK